MDITGSTHLLLYPSLDRSSPFCLHGAIDDLGQERKLSRKQVNLSALSLFNQREDLMEFMVSLVVVTSSSIGWGEPLYH